MTSFLRRHGNGSAVSRALAVTGVLRSQSVDPICHIYIVVSNAWTVFVVVSPREST